MKRNNSRSLLVLLLKSFVLVTVIVFILFLAFYSMMTKSMDSFNKRLAPDYHEIAKQKKTFEQGGYTQINLSNYLGSEYDMLIYSQNHDLIYTTSDTNLSFQQDELDKIPNISQKGYYFVNEIKDGTESHKSILYFEDSKEGDVIESTGYAKLNENNEVIKGNLFKKGTFFSDKELNLMCGEYNQKNVKKMTFTGKDGEEYTAVFLSLQADPRSYDEMMSLWDKGWIFFTALYILMIVVSLIWLSKKIVKLLNPLNEAIIDSMNNHGADLKNYQGPKEFKEIVNNFDNLNRQLEVSENKRKKLEQEKSKMLSNISHDLKTPVTAIMGYSTALLDGTIEEDQDKYLYTIYKKANTISALIDQFSEFSQLERADNKLQFVKTDLCEYCRAMLAERYYEFEIGGFDLKVDIPEEAIYYDIDVLYFQRVFNNLFDNAMKYNKNGTTLYFSIKQELSKILISVGNDGNEIDQTIADSLFQAFVKGDQSMNHGTGLGLSIVKSIIGMHNGKIELVDSEKSKYKVEFLITLYRFKS